MDIIQPEDYKYRVETPDPNFSPARNKAIINETIKETEKFFSQVSKAMTDELDNRNDILSHYALYRFGRGNKKFKDYIGKHMWEGLIGERILQKVRMMDTVNRLNKNTGEFAKTIQI